MFSTLEAQVGVTPAGSPVAVPIPVAPVVVWVIAVSAVLIHNVGLEDAVPAVLVGVTVFVIVLLVAVVVFAHVALEVRTTLT
jgi:hypothetical protein